MACKCKNKGGEEFNDGESHKKALAKSDKNSDEIADNETTLSLNDCTISTGGICVLDPKLIKKVAEEVDIQTHIISNPEKIIEVAKEKTNCNSEFCVYSKTQILKENPEIEKKYFKPEGPKNDTKLLSNHNIDENLQQWAANDFPNFFNFDFNMIDFFAVKSSLATTNVADIINGKVYQKLPDEKVKRPCNVFACVLNTDVSTGRGKHWVAVFGDCRGDKWTVEYFNSAGNPPSNAVTKWMERSVAELKTIHENVESVSLTDIRHQNSRTECGVYTLYYIRRRLEGAPISDFTNTLISDEKMKKFRKFLFRES